MINAQTFSNQDLKLKLPFGCVVAGPSGSGKSTFVQKLIANADNMIIPKPDSIAYFYGQYSSMVPEFQRAGVLVSSGVPSEEQLKKLAKPALVILDDLLYSIDPKYLSELFTKLAHHLNLGLIFIVQDIFEKRVKTARQNSQYIVLARAPSSALSIRNLGIQLFPGPGQLQFFLDAYRQATREKYSYLFIDLHPSSDSALRLRSNIFKHDDAEPMTIFIPKSGISTN